MTKQEAITLHAKPENWEKFPVFVWQEGKELVTSVDGKVFRERNIWLMDTALDTAGIPAPRNLYAVDKPDYEVV
jgi:hypothetical protein